MSDASAATHDVIIMDRSPAGLRAADQLLEAWPQVDERMGPWRASDDAFFVFFLEQTSGGRAGSVTARDLDDLLQSALPLLFDTALAPPAVATVAIAAEGPAFQSINDRIEQLSNRP